MLFIYTLELHSRGVLYLPALVFSLSSVFWFTYILNPLISFIRSTCLKQISLLILTSLIVFDLFNMAITFTSRHISSSQVLEPSPSRFVQICPGHTYFYTSISHVMLNKRKHVVNPCIKMSRVKYLNVLLFVHGLLVILNKNKSSLIKSVFMLRYICKQYNTKISTIKIKLIAFRVKDQ